MCFFSACAKWRGRGAEDLLYYVKTNILRKVQNSLVENLATVRAHGLTNTSAHHRGILTPP